MAGDSSWWCCELSDWRRWVPAERDLFGYGGIRLSDDALLINPPKPPGHSIFVTLCSSSARVLLHYTRLLLNSPLICQGVVTSVCNHGVDYLGVTLAVTVSADTIVVERMAGTGGTGTGGGGGASVGVALEVAPLSAGGGGASDDAGGWRAGVAAARGWCVCEARVLACRCRCRAWVVRL